MISRIIKSKMSIGFRRALRNLWTEHQIYRMHQKGKRQARKYAGQLELKLHVGCGDKIKAGWVNIDLHPSANVSLDLRKPLPFGDGSSCVIYSEHFMEHLEHPDETIPFLREAFRVLRSGGRFSVGVPDIEWPVRAYAGDPNCSGWFEYVMGVYPQSEWLQTKADCVNYSFRQGTQHKYAWDFETMKRALQIVGFADVKRRPFDPALDNEKSHYAFGPNMSKDTTLYVDARKA